MLLQTALSTTSYIFLSLVLPILLLSSILNKKPFHTIHYLFSTGIEVITYILQKVIQLYNFLKSSSKGDTSGGNGDNITDDSGFYNSDSNRSSNHSENDHKLDDFFVCDKYFHCNHKGEMQEDPFEGLTIDELRQGNDLSLAFREVLDNLVYMNNH